MMAAPGRFIRGGSMKALCSLLALTMVLGCGSAFAADKNKTGKTDAKQDTKTEPKKDSKTEAKADNKTVEAKVPQDKAKEAAMKLCPGEFLCWDLQIEDGIPEYAFYIKGKDGRISEAEMDGNTGKKTNIGVLIESWTSDGSKIKTTNAKDLARLKEPKLTREQTQEKALKAYAGKVDAWELLLWEHGTEGKLVFDFRIAGKDGKKVVTIDSKDGSTVSISKFVKGEGR
jgi:uncharacterized membrane protein YkoI